MSIRCQFAIAKKNDWSYSSRTIGHVHERRLVIAKQDNSSSPKKSIGHSQAGRIVISKQDDSSFPGRTIRHFHAGRFVIPRHDGPSFPHMKNSNNLKIARMTPSSTIFWRNRSQRPALLQKINACRRKQNRIGQNFSRQQNIIALLSSAVLLGN